MIQRPSSDARNLLIVAIINLNRRGRGAAGPALSPKILERCCLGRGRIPALSLVCLRRTSPLLTPRDPFLCQYPLYAALRLRNQTFNPRLLPIWLPKLAIKRINLAFEMKCHLLTHLLSYSNGERQEATPSPWTTHSTKKSIYLHSKMNTNSKT